MVKRENIPAVVALCQPKSLIMAIYKTENEYHTPKATPNVKNEVATITQP
jgi:hypothetical protein